MCVYVCVIEREKKRGRREREREMEREIYLKKLAPRTMGTDKSEIYRTARHSGNSIN